MHQLADVITDPDELLQLLSLNTHPELPQGRDARRLFALRVPRAFAARMRPGMPTTRCCAVLTAREEFINAPWFTTDPLDEQRSVVPGLLHKYRNRALLLVKGGCAVNCRYCFRRHFPIRIIRAIRTTGGRHWIISANTRNWTRSFFRRRSADGQRQRAGMAGR